MITKLIHLVVAVFILSIHPAPDSSNVSEGQAIVIARLAFSQYSPQDPPSATIFELDENGTIQVSSDWRHGRAPARVYQLTDSQLKDVRAKLSDLYAEAGGRRFVNLADRHIGAHILSLRVDGSELILRSSQSLSRSATLSDRLQLFVGYAEQKQLDYVLWEEIKDVLQQAVITAASNDPARNP